MDTAAAAASSPEISHIEEDVAIDLIDFSPTNPRKIFDPEKLKELAATIKAQGLLQRVLVRPSPKTPGRFELVFGERRVKGCKLLRWEKIPANIRQMTDLEVIEAQAVENNQREDVHPLEEAELFRVWSKRHNVTIEQICAKIGRKRGYVFARMKLGDLSDKARELFLGGKFDTAVALQIARIPNKELQDKAALEIGEPKYGEPLTFLGAQELIRERYQMRLELAPFPTGDATLTPAGPCSSCPKRTGNQKELFADIKDDDTCTDPDCFAQKKKAALERELEAARAAGSEVLTGKRVKEVFEVYPHGGGHLKRDSGYVDAEAICHDDPKNRTYAKLLKGEGLTVADVGGKLVKLVPSDGLKALLREAGHDFGKAQHEKKKQEKREEKKKATKPDTAAIHELAAPRAMAEVVAKLEKKEPTFAVWQLIAEYLAETSAADTGMTLRRRIGTEKPLGQYGGFNPTNIAKMIKQVNSAPAMRALAIELIFDNAIEFDLGGDFVKLAKAVGVDVKAIEKAAGEELQQKAEDEKALAAGDLFRHRKGCSKSGFIFKLSKDGGNVGYHPKKGGVTSTGAGSMGMPAGKKIKGCPECDGPFIREPMAAKKKGGRQ